ncbi:NAD(P)H-binding protein [Nocardiopsis sp. HNM0947]|uniref:NAD(P)H-binding protein n=1 Tax=Nocardiopsis coralli TaxID=2772213 RepID=A0ABR9P0X0_9ACTN|nr:NAD(P)H-binding protein [Nocardiopsis coralli]MBE2997504.1 NAD(P)H-binding protein [Nocardiopsis coralli]
MHVLVTGAGGAVGGLVAESLLSEGAQVSALTRSPDRCSFPDGVRVLGGDLTVPDSLDGVFDGVDAVFLLVLARDHDAVVERMRAAGVRRVVVLSSSSVENDGDGSEGNFGHMHHRPLEYAVERSGMEWTHVRGGEFMLNDLDDFPASVRTEGVIRAPHGDQPGAPVHERDVADVAVAALLREGHTGRAYELTGPEAITPAQRAEVISRALGRTVSFVHLSLAEARELWISNGVPPQLCDWLLWGSDPEDEGAEWDLSQIVSPDYERVMGHPGRDYASWVADHVDAFR